MATKLTKLDKRNLDKLPGMLWDLRTASGFTQSEVAKKIGKQQSYISHIESAEKKKIPQLKSLIPYLEAIKATIYIVPKGYKITLVEDDSE